MSAAVRAVFLASYSGGRPVREGDFEIRVVASHELNAGEVRLRPLAFSVDPYLRGRMTGIDNFYLPQFSLGEPLASAGVGRVIESRHPDFSPGDIATGQLAWSDESVWPAADQRARRNELKPVDLSLAGPTQWLGALGLNGMCAYFGVLNVARPRPGTSFLVSGAAGGIGHLAGQIARIEGCHVVGIAGALEKCKVLTQRLGFDAAVSYRSPTLEADLRAVLPGGPDVYFDNVGGALSQTVMWNMPRNGLVVECGQIATYDDQDGGWTTDIRPIHANGLQWRSFTASHFAEYVPAATAQLGHWLRTGRVIALETVLRGLDALPEAMVGVLAGRNLGKMVVHIDD